MSKPPFLEEPLFEDPGLDLISSINQLELDDTKINGSVLNSTWSPHFNRPNYSYGHYFNPLDEPYELKMPAFSPPEPLWNPPPQYNMRRYRNDMNVHRKNTFGHRRKGDDAAKYANCKLDDFVGEIYTLCKDQHGCRFLQRQLDLGKDAPAQDVAATIIFNEVYLKIVELMTDPFGNYLVQKLFESVNCDQRLVLVKNCAPDLVRIALDPHGTRALQKLIECVKGPQEIALVIDALRPYVVSLSRDLNGNHVVQKCLQQLGSGDNQFIFDAAIAHCVEIATHRHGCCVLQRCLDHGDTNQCNQFSLEVARNATVLSLDPFGNYVVQYVLARGHDVSIQKIVEHVKANFVPLCLHKFGSNVIEKTMRIPALSKEMIGVLLGERVHFGKLLNDAYGNYVLQTSLDVADEEDFGRLGGGLEPLLVGIRGTPHGRRILMRLNKV